MLGNKISFTVRMRQEQDSPAAFCPLCVRSVGATESAVTFAALQRVILEIAVREMTLLELTTAVRDNPAVQLPSRFSVLIFPVYFCWLRPKCLCPGHIDTHPRSFEPSLMTRRSE